MTEYLTHLNHFRFEKDGEEIVVTSERDDIFEERYDIPDDLEVSDNQSLFQEYYTDVYSAFHEHKS